VILLVLSLVLAPMLASRFGLSVDPWAWSANESLLLAAVAVAGIAAGLIPAYRACRLALADGLTPRL